MKSLIMALAFAIGAAAAASTALAKTYIQTQEIGPVTGFAHELAPFARHDGPGRLESAVLSYTITAGMPICAICTSLPFAAASFMPLPTDTGLPLYRSELRGSGAYGPMAQISTPTLALPGMNTLLRGNIEMRDLSDFTGSGLVAGALTLAGLTFSNGLGQPFSIATPSLFEGSMSLRYEVADIAPVPLPASMPLLLGAFAVAAGLRRRAVRATA
ncbi:VPLPA-CTERM sorting domain-containing protein [Profundibacterium mesophilum]|uniref:Na+H+ antiporter n=1 Tax=Profundibacterium mesophilum KAUST100406-0324 TaxID=1037889 RepID=A0A921TBU4_9RHOB|nr:VPLPA-CTERM sorting domain-containing protein [Profundibacterium mesophilum]KAF0674848.1 putative Na+H+ antiporter [Profundibacterium mesophilum KAUST100406-0324]